MSALRETDPLYQEILEAEKQLCDPVRMHSNLGRLNALLHPDYEEVTRSGNLTDRDQCLHWYEFYGLHGKPLHVEQFAACRVADTAVLTTYRTHVAGSKGRPTRQGHQSSLWLRTDKGWQIRHHQETAC